MAELKELIDQLTSGDDELAEEAARQLGCFGPDALPPLAELLHSHEVDVRWWAVRAVAAVSGDPAVDDLLCLALHDPDAAVQQCAALGISLHPNPTIIPDLVVCLAGKDQLLARLAGNALIAVGKDAVPALIEIMEKGPQIARLEAVKALAEIADERAIPVFHKAILDGDSQLIEYWADVGLEKLGVGMTFFKPS